MIAFFKIFFCKYLKVRKFIQQIKNVNLLPKISFFRYVIEKLRSYRLFLKNGIIAYIHIL